MPADQERRQSIASKESVVSSIHSVCTSLGTVNVRRPSSATSYSFGSTSGANLRHASISSIGAVTSGMCSSNGGAGNVPGVVMGGATVKTQHENQGNESLSKPGISEERQIPAFSEPPNQQPQRADSTRAHDSRVSPTIPPTRISSGKLIHPGMEIFNYDTGKRPICERQHPTPPLQPAIRPKIVSAFNPTNAFFVSQAGTPGLIQSSSEGKQKKHLLKSRGWEIRDASGAIQRTPKGSEIVHREGEDVGRGKNTIANIALESVTEEIFSSWGCWADSGSRMLWRRSFDTSRLSPASSSSSFFSQFRSPAPQTPTTQSPSLTPAPRPSIDSRTGNLPAIRSSPPDPSYVSLKPYPTSSKSTLYSIETAPISGDFKVPKARGSHSETYPSETGRIPISQWRVPYSINSPSTVTLLNFYDSQNNPYQGQKLKPQKSKKVEVWAEASDVRTQFFEMDKSTYTWEFRERSKIKIPVTAVTPSFLTSPAGPNPLLPTHLSPTTPSFVSSLSGGGTHSSLTCEAQKVVKFRSEVLTLVKEVDGTRYIVAEYYFPRSLKSTTITPVPVGRRLKRFLPTSSTPTLMNVRLPPSTTSASHQQLFKEKEKVQYTNLGTHQSGILLLDARGVNKVVALNSLLLSLKRERQRKIVTLNTSRNGARSKRWGYDVYDHDVGDNLEGIKGTEDGGVSGDANDVHTAAVGDQQPRHLVECDIKIQAPGKNDTVSETGQHVDSSSEFDDGYSLQGDEWEYDETEGWKRRGASVVGSRGGVG